MSLISDSKLAAQEAFISRAESGHATEVREVCDQCNPPEELLAQVMVILLAAGEHDASDRVFLSKELFMREVQAHAEYLRAAG